MGDSEGGDIRKEQRLGGRGGSKGVDSKGETWTEGLGGGRLKGETRGEGDSKGGVHLEGDCDMDIGYTKVIFFFFTQYPFF